MSSTFDNGFRGLLNAIPAWLDERANNEKIHREMRAVLKASDFEFAMRHSDEQLEKAESAVKAAFRMACEGIVEEHVSNFHQ